MTQWQDHKSFGAYVSHLPGCVAVGETLDEALLIIREAVDLHLNEIRKGASPTGRGRPVRVIHRYTIDPRPICSAGPATGNAVVHKAELAHLVDAAFEFPESR